MKKIELVLEFGNSLQTGKIASIKTDPVRLGQVVTNLISNGEMGKGRANGSYPFHGVERYTPDHCHVQRFLFATFGRYVCASLFPRRARQFACSRGHPDLVVC
jgi:hypothetical protein